MQIVTFFTQYLLLLLPIFQILDNTWDSGNAITAGKPVLQVSSLISEVFSQVSKTFGVRLIFFSLFLRFVKKSKQKHSGLVLTWFPTSHSHAFSRA